MRPDAWFVNQRIHNKWKILVFRINQILQEWEFLLFALAICLDIYFQLEWIWEGMNRSDIPIIGFSVSSFHVDHSIHFDFVFKKFVKEILLCFVILWFGMYSMYFSTCVVCVLFVSNSFFCFHLFGELWLLNCRFPVSCTYCNTCGVVRFQKSMLTVLITVLLQ